MMKFIDDHDVEVLRIEVRKPGRAETLDRCENVVEPIRSRPAYP